MKAAEPTVTKSAAAPPPPPEPEHLPCPRCDSTNTKFCYYNNYNFSQPRHFCKSCRRYWTHGGTLRDIPIGGGSRKNAKRSRTTTASAAVSAFSLPRHDFRNFPATAAASQLLFPFGGGDHGGSFTSLLNTQGTGVWALGGFGPGPGLDEVGFGLGKSVWPFQGVVEGGPTNGNGVGPMNTWQVESGGDCFGFPDLAISTPGGSFIMK